MAISVFAQGDYLDAWRSSVYQDVWRFNQVLGLGIPDTNETVYIQSEREWLGQSLATSIRKMKRYLRFSLRPEYEIAEPANSFDYRYRSRGQIVHTRYKHLKALGLKTKTLIEADVTVNYSNVGNVGIDDTATITVTTPIDAGEVFAFFRTADGANAAGSDTYQILPLRYERNGTDVILTGSRALFVSPALYWNRPYENATNLERNAADTTAVGDFVEAVDIYRVYPDATKAVKAVQYRACDGCTPRERWIEAVIVDPLTGGIRLCDGGACWSWADRLELNYLAGYPETDQTMDGMLKDALTRLTNAEMPHYPNAAIGNVQPQWKNDYKVPEEGVGTRFVNNPFGLRNGHIAAWRTVEAMALGQGLL